MSGMRAGQPGPLALLRFFFGGPKGRWTPGPPPLPVQTALPQGEGLLFIGHSTLLLTIGGVRILIDPVFHRAGPGGLLGPKRYAPPGMAERDLPPIDAVLISHNHYDHLELPVIKRLVRRDDPLLLLPGGCVRVLPRSCRRRAEELGEWETLRVTEGLAVTAVPARHFSGRGLLDGNRSRWCGFVLEAGSRRIFYAGDTAYGDHFRAIGARFPGLNEAILPIGAYRPEWMMRAIHLDPEEALRAFMETGARRMVACHHRTFRLSWEGREEPAERLRAAALDAGVQVLLPAEGEWIPFT